MTDAHPRGFAGRRETAQHSLGTFSLPDEFARLVDSALFGFGYHDLDSLHRPAIFDIRDAESHDTHNPNAESHDPSGWDAGDVRIHRNTQQT